MKYRIAYLAALCVVSGVAQAADTYPSRPIRMIVAYPPGGGTDQVGRVMADQLSQTLGQNVVVDNRGGATGNIGTELAARAVPDGYTLLMGNVAPNAVNVSLFKKLGFDPVRDFAPVSLVAVTPNSSFRASRIWYLFASGSTTKVYSLRVWYAAELFSVMSGRTITR